MKIKLTIIGLFMMITAGAQDSLSYYLSLAAKNNPVVLQKYYDYLAALQKVPQVGGLPDPEISMGVFLSPMELVNGNQIADLRLMQMFPWFGTLRAAKDEMSLMANAKYELFRDAKLQVLYEVQSIWYDMYKVRQRIEYSEKNIEILKTVERLALIRFRYAATGSGSTSTPGNAMSSDIPESPSGGSQGMGGMEGNAVNDAVPGTDNGSQTMQGNSMGSPAGGPSLADLYRLQIEVSDLENEVALLMNRQNTLVALFNSHLNRPATTAVSLPDSLTAGSLDIPLGAVSDSMLANNPMLAMLQYEQKSLESRKKMVTRMSYPMIGMGLNYSLIKKSEMSASTMNGRDMVMPMVTMTLPVYRRKYHAMRAEADLLKDAVVQDYTASANNLITEYYQAVQLFQDARRRISLYTDQGLLAGKSLEIMIQRFATSGSDLSDLLLVRRQTLDYDFKRVEAVADYNTAIAWLNRLMAIQQMQ